jgi:hypothetical protein
MSLTEKVAYLNGLMSGLDINDSTPEGKVLLQMADILSEMADVIEEFRMKSTKLLNLLIQSIRILAM